VGGIPSSCWVFVKFGFFSQFTTVGNGPMYGFFVPSDVDDDDDVVVVVVALLLSLSPATVLSLAAVVSLDEIDVSPEAVDFSSFGGCSCCCCG
jgi:hypothetical protein